MRYGIIKKLLCLLCLQLAMGIVDVARADTTNQVTQLEQVDLDSPALEKLLTEASKLSMDEANVLAEKLARSPKDLPTRIRLIGFYQPSGSNKGQVALEKYTALILGIIEHHPRSQLAGNIGLLLVPRYFESDDYTAWDKGAQLWTKLVAEYPEDAHIVGNAGSYLSSDMFKPNPKGLELLERARVLEPKNPNWAKMLGEMHWRRTAMRADLSKEERQVSARKGLEHLEAHYELTRYTDPSPNVDGQNFFQLMAECAFKVGDAEKTKLYAAKVLEAADKRKADWNSGNELFAANHFLGLIALKEDKLEEAKKYLLAAGKTPGSPQLNSFGPDFSLARELLARGEKEVVLEFFELCRSFWKLGGKQLDNWTQAVKEGKTPDFSRQARY